MSGTVPDPIRRQLLTGENVAWWGTPKQGVMLVAGDIYFIPFSLVWCGGAISIGVSTIRKGVLDIGVFAAPLLVLIGLFIALGRFLLDAWLRRRTTYVLTDRRVLIVRSGPWPSLTALQLATLPEATLTERGKKQGRRRGTIRFGGVAAPSGGATAFGAGGVVPSLDPTPQFLGIADAGQVFALLQERLARSRLA